MSVSRAQTRSGWSHPTEIPFARGDPEAPAVADSSGELTTGQFADQVRRVAGGLTALGLGPGDVLATMLPNRRELATILFAGWSAGATVTPVNPALTADEAGYQLQDAGARLVVVDETSAEVLKGAGVKRVTLDELMSTPGQDTPRAARRDDLALLIYTSGTTGHPKGVMLDHANVTAMVRMLVVRWSVTEADRALVPLPLFHVNGLVASVLTPLSAGGSVVILERFSRSGFWEEVKRWRPTYFSLVPAMYLMFNAMPDGLAPDTSTLRFCVCGAAPIPAEQLERFYRRFGIPILESYGLSETTVGVSSNPLDGPRKPGSVGVPFPGIDVRIVDDHDRTAPCGEAGEITVRGPNIMRGYLGKPTESRAALRGGWLHTGDVGYLDSDGYLFIVDRKKDMIIRGGENVYPKEIENVLGSHPAVLEAAVVGKQDQILGEVPVAFVALKEPGGANDAELAEYARDRLAPYKLPEEFRIVDALPRNPVGKVLKGELRGLV